MYSDTKAAVSLGADLLLSECEHTSLTSWIMPELHSDDTAPHMQTQI